MIIYADFIGVFVAALSGALVAARKEMDVFGFVVLGIVTGLGGGTIRDVLLDVPVFWVRTEAYLAVGLSAGLLAFVLARQAMNGWRRKMILWLDALAMSFFAATGGMKAFNNDAGALVIVLMAFMTATAGGLLRDMMAQETPYIFRGEIYGSAALLGGLVIVLLSHLDWPHQWLVPSAMLAAFCLRALAIIFDWRLSAIRRVD